MTFEMTLIQFLLLYQIKLPVTTAIPIELEQPKNNHTKVKFGKENILNHSGISHDAKTVIRSDFDQETAEKIAPLLARLDT